MLKIKLNELGYICSPEFERKVSTVLTIIPHKESSHFNAGSRSTLAMFCSNTLLF